MYIRNIFIIFTSILCTQGFDFKLKYCRFRCSNSCETPEDKSNPVGSSDPPGAYYWRDFHGVIPTDAYPLGPSTQYPQTYIGFVYDPSKNGTFVTTIFDGLDYVYTVRDNETTKLEETIQILCTKSPGQLSWVKLTNDNLKTITADRKNVRGGLHLELINNRTKPANHYIVKTNKCHITYAGFVKALNVDLEYALIDGSADSTDEYLWLMYKEDDPANDAETSAPSPTKSFFSHHYEYSIRPDSIIPKFYKQITIGSCSVTCTNEDNDKMKEIKKNEELEASMAYFWKPGPVVDKEEAFLAGEDRFKRPLYVGQAFISSNIWDDGPSDLKSSTVVTPSASVVESSYYHVLSSNFPEKLKWVDTTPEDFPNQDMKRMIPGGAYDNGTKSYVCRELDTQYDNIYIGSARLWTMGTYCSVQWGAAKKYQLLMFDKE